ncbi:MAG: hypothetical protein E7458_08450 [Ruminococcaceae bacterium]|nr:hypothetical protein [Oscillospiraceae bacterium]
MKRIKSACICQTIHFQKKEDLDHELAIRELRAEYETYFRLLDKRRIPYRLVKEETLPDGSILIHIMRQYNMYPTGDYLK